MKHHLKEGTVAWEPVKKGRKKSTTSRQAPTRKTEAALDRRQNSRMLIRQCPSGIAQRPPHHATAVPTAMQNRATKTMSVAPPLGSNWSKRSPTLKPSSTSLLLISSRLSSSWESSSPPSSWSCLDSVFFNKPCIVGLYTLQPRRKKSGQEKGHQWRQNKMAQPRHPVWD